MAGSAGVSVIGREKSEVEEYGRFREAFYFRDQIEKKEKTPALIARDYHCFILVASSLYGRGGEGKGSMNAYAYA